MASPLPPLPCACATLRRASRAVTQVYDTELRPTGLRITQFTLLQALAHAGEMPHGRLGHVLALDSTTLTRTLVPLLEQGWIEARPGQDRRERLYHLTAAGRARLDEALPLWERAQDRVKAVVAGDWTRLQQMLDHTAASLSG